MESYPTEESRIRHLYLHIPFCPKKCTYCAFVTHIGSVKLVEPYVQALIAEMDLLPTTAPSDGLDTVYLGGGTPSMLTPAQVASILDAADRCIGIRPNCEVTLEAHPATVTGASLAGYRLAGITRLSFGAETLQPEELRALGRDHAPGSALDLIRWSRRAGVQVAVDLMYGLPLQTPQSWRESLRRITDAGPDHLSLYPLSIEPKTVFARRQRRGDLTVPDDDAVVSMYHDACEITRRSGYLHYEVANWARNGHECRHNLAYWYNRQFYGAGVGAHGYLAPYRTENMRGTRAYIERLSAGMSPIASKEPINASIALAETVVLRLRLLREGLDLTHLRRQFGPDAVNSISPDLRWASDLGLLEVDGDRVLLAEHAVPLANEVWDRFVALNPAR